MQSSAIIRDTGAICGLGSCSRADLLLFMAYSVAVNQGLLTLMQTAKSTFLAILLALLFASLLGACGLKGPLYLPQDEPAAKPDAEQSTEPSEDEEEKQHDGHEC